MLVTTYELINNNNIYCKSTNDNNSKTLVKEEYDA